jgi:hypothetical protein
VYIRYQVTLLSSSILILVFLHIFFDPSKKPIQFHAQEWYHFLPCRPRARGREVTNHEIIQ